MLSVLDDIKRLAGIGPSVASKFHKLGIVTVSDLLEYVPFRFDDYSKLSQVSEIRPGLVTVKVTFSSINVRYSKKGLHMTEALASDASGSVKIMWFNQPYRAKSLQQGVSYFVSGEFGSNYKYFAITNPACELVSNFPVHTARLVPVYRLTKGLGLAQIRKAVKLALETSMVPESLPSWLIDEEDLMPKFDALQQMHFPIDHIALQAARRRLGFEEIFELTLASELNKQAYKSNHSRVIPFNEKLIREYVASLHFDLTDDQRKVAWQIFQDMSEGSPMNRLVEGDVGSGKTVIAAMSALSTMNEGMQVAFMAPTELLAHQHEQSIRESFRDTEYGDSIALLTGSIRKTQKIKTLEDIKSGEVKLIVGTHSIFQDAVVYHNLGLVIVDEQHRFGVDQRKKLQAKASPHMPHVLHMTATPIPRSLALTLYGELDVSLLKQMPSGRIPVKTNLYIPENREGVYRAVLSEVARGRQAFVVCPQIEEDDAGRLGVVSMYNQLSKKWLKTARVGLLHGKMTSQEKEHTMQQFVRAELDVLVATTVIEVGVNVPNANYMVIEGADRFGLAQLHQLRGRVGRASDQAYCALILESNDSAPARLKLMEREHSGFVLADYDLSLRGPGAIYGFSQHGALDLRVARLDDTDLIKSARAAAKEFISKEEDLLHYKQLNERVLMLRSVTNLN